MESLAYLETDDNKQEEIGSTQVGNELGLQVQEWALARAERVSHYLEGQGNDVDGLVSSSIVEITYRELLLSPMEENNDLEKGNNKGLRRVTNTGLK